MVVYSMDWYLREREVGSLPREFVSRRGCLVIWSGGLVGGWSVFGHLVRSSIDVVVLSRSVPLYCRRGAVSPDFYIRPMSSPTFFIID